MLANPFYQRQFNYIPVSLPDRSDYIVDDDSDEENDCEQSDLVSVMLNLAYLKRDYACNFKLEKGFSSMQLHKRYHATTFSQSLV